MSADLPHSPHPATAAILALVPGDRYGQVITGYSLGDGESRGDPVPLAAQYAATGFRVVADWVDRRNRDAECACSTCLRDEADEIEGAVR